MFNRRAQVETVTVPKTEYLALCDRASSETARRVLEDTPAPAKAQRVTQPVPVAFDEQQIAVLLEQHYKDVLTSKAGRAMWRKLLREAATAEAYTKIGK